MAQVRFSENSAGRSALLLGGIVVVLLFGKVLLIPLAFALALCFLLLPALALLEKRGVSRGLAVVLVSISTFVCLGTAAYFLSRQVLYVAQTLPSYSAHIQAEIDTVHSPAMETIKSAVKIVENYAGYLTSGAGKEAENAAPVRVVGQGADGLRTTAQLIGAVLEPLGQIGIVLIFTIYMLIYREELRHRLLILAGLGQLNSMTKAIGDATTRISQYLVMQIQVNACFGIEFGIGLHFLDVPYAILWGVIAGVLRIVPFVGGLAAMVFPLILSVAVSAGWWHPLLVIALFIMLELVVANVVEPRLFSSRTGISELALLASAIFWSMLWGWPGLILSTPLTVCVVVMGRYVPQFSFLHSLLGTNAKLSPAAHVYERLLAMDRTEAWAIAERHLDGKPLVQLYDSVVLPVLSMAEEDRHKGALTDLQAKFVRLSIEELVARLREYQPRLSPEDKSTKSHVLEALHTQFRKEFAVICVWAGDKGDELATQMLTQLLEQVGHQTILLRPDSLTDEILRALAGEKETVIFISALPPFVFAQTRALCQRVRTHLPKNRIAVALWHSGEDADAMLARFGAARPDIIVGTLADAMGQVKTWQQASRRV
jgi:predicted PurR-regulated permease PerM